MPLPAANHLEYNYLRYLGQNGIYDQTNSKGEMEYSAISSMTIEDFWKEYVDKKVPRMRLRIHYRR